ncbi:MAG: IS4 family transposase, partial [Planctomyces sp.]|nr:IS4 family transposase [Planctomyces sp.]
LPKRTATVELRFSEIRMPTPKVLTPWLKKHRCNEDLTLWVVELREVNAPKGIKGLHWVLYTFEPVTTIDVANKVIKWYEMRPTIEDYHKAFKTGCSVQKRYYATADRLERVTALLSIVAVRLMQLKTAALETPDRPAREVAPVQWVRLVQTARRKPVNENMTIHQFIRALAGLGGHLGRKSDGEPGWITVWRGFEKLMLIVRGANLAEKKCG